METYMLEVKIMVLELLACTGLDFIAQLALVKMRGGYWDAYAMRGSVPATISWGGRGLR